MIRVADYIAEFLWMQGVRDIFMLTGNGAMYMNDAIAQSSINFFCARNEAAAPMMAEAYARVRQSLGAVCVTSGPGSTNAIPGLAEAWVDSAPVLILSGQVQRSHTSHNTGFPAIRSFGTAEINIIPIVQPLTKYAAMINDPTEVRYHLEKAVHLATTGRPGPVWLDVPMDVQYALVDPSELEGYTPEFDLEAEDEIDTSVDQLFQLLSSSRRPLLVCGHGVRLAGATADLKRLLDTARIPAIFSRLGQDLVPHSHPQNFGHGGIKGRSSCWPIMKGADLVISLGCRLSIQLVGHKFDAFSPDATVVMVDIEEAEMRKPGVKVDVPINADVKRVLGKLNARLAKDSLPDWRGWVQSCRRIADKHPVIGPDLQHNPIDLYYFMSKLDEMSDRRHIMVTDAGSNFYVGGQVYRFEQGQREITSGTFASMGLSVPLAIGASIAEPNAQVLAVTGDGSLELNIQELKTMSHYGLNIKLFVINNGGYLSMRNWQDGYFEGRRIDGPESTGAGTLDLAKTADTFGLEYVRIDRYEEIDAKLASIMANDRPMFVEVVCDPNQRIISSTDSTVEGSPILDVIADSSDDSMKVAV